MDQNSIGVDNGLDLPPPLTVKDSQGRRLIERNFAQMNHQGMVYFVEHQISEVVASETSRFCPDDSTLVSAKCCRNEAPNRRNHRVRQVRSWRPPLPQLFQNRDDVADFPKLVAVNSGCQPPRLIRSVSLGSMKTLYF